MAIFPNFPTSGKNSKVEVSTGDGPLLTLEAMTLEASKKYRGEFYDDRIYTLGTGRTLINVRPAEQPSVAIDGILEGGDCTPGAFTSASTTVDMSRAVVDVNGTQTVVAAKTGLAITRPNTTNWCWALIVYDIGAGDFEAVDGSANEVATEGLLLDTYGSGAGQKPTIDTDHILLNAIKVQAATHAAIPSANILYTDRMYGGVDYTILPNIGGVLLQTALVKAHLSGSDIVSRSVKFTGRYLDGLMVPIGTAKSWNLTPNTSDVSDETFAAGYSQTEIGGWTFSFEQLAADKKVVEAAFQRQGHCAIRLIFPNGFGFQGVATVAPTINSQVGSFININVSGSFGDFPEEYSA
jgi:hypothetical protein